MKVLVQRVQSASVIVSGETISEIGFGLLLFVGFTEDDREAVVHGLAEKVVNLRIFPDTENRLQHSVIEVDGQVLAVPQFTLYATTNRGRRPDFTQAMEPETASRLFGQFVGAVAEKIAKPVAQGQFGADMKVALINDGPFTIMLSRESS
jgi:D-tyrosyl-tRNA(Tyr) deacylase